MRWQAAFKQNLVPPTITEIVFVGKVKTNARWRNDVADHGFQRVGTDETIGTAAEKFRVAMHEAKDLEPMEMRVRPSHGGLNALVQLIDRAIFHLDAPPN